MIGTAIINRCWEGGPTKRPQSAPKDCTVRIPASYRARSWIVGEARPHGLELSSRPGTDQVKKYNKAGMTTTATPVSPTLLR